MFYSNGDFSVGDSGKKAGLLPYTWVNKDGYEHFFKFGWTIEHSKKRAEQAVNLAASTREFFLSYF